MNCCSTGVKDSQTEHNVQPPPCSQMTFPVDGSLISGRNLHVVTSRVSETMYFAPATEIDSMLLKRCWLCSDLHLQFQFIIS